jgi:hypothetical protein
MTYVGLVFLRLLKGLNLYFPLLIAIFLFSAFRFEVGCDWTGYLNEFNVFTVMPVSEIFSRQDPLWSLVFVFQNWLGLPYPWINVFSSVIFFGGAHVLARRQPDPVAFLILLFPILIINIVMSGIRQGAAIGVLCMAFVAFIDGRLVRFVVLTLVATALHSSAMVFLLLAPLAGGKLSRKRLVASTILAIPGAILLLSTHASEVAESRYIGTKVEAYGAAFRVGLLVLSAVFFFAFLRRKWAMVFPRDYKLAFIGALGMAGLAFLVPISTVIGDRLGYYFVPIQAMIFARAPYLTLRGSKVLLVWAPYAGLLIVLAVWIGLSKLFQLCYLPYQTWLLGFPIGKFYMQY